VSAETSLPLFLSSSINEIVLYCIVFRSSHMDQFRCEPQRSTNCTCIWTFTELRNYFYSTKFIIFELKAVSAIIPLLIYCLTTINDPMVFNSSSVLITMIMSLVSSFEYAPMLVLATI